MDIRPALFPGVRYGAILIIGNEDSFGNSAVVRVVVAEGAGMVVVVEQGLIANSDASNTGEDNQSSLILASGTPSPQLGASAIA